MPVTCLYPGKEKKRKKKKEEFEHRAGMDLDKQTLRWVVDQVI